MRDTYRVVGWFVSHMLEKLRQNEHKGDRWLSDNPADLMDRVRQEMFEAAGAMGRGEGPEVVAGECADIANMAMMAADAYRDQSAAEGEG